MIIIQTSHIAYYGFNLLMVDIVTLSPQSYGPLLSMCDSRKCLFSLLFTPLEFSSQELTCITSQHRFLTIVTFYS